MGTITIQMKDLLHEYDLMYAKDNHILYRGTDVFISIHNTFLRILYLCAKMTDSAYDAIYLAHDDLDEIPDSILSVQRELLGYDIYLEMPDVVYSTYHNRILVADIKQFKSYSKSGVTDFVCEALSRMYGITEIHDDYFPRYLCIENLPDADTYLQIRKALGQFDIQLIYSEYSEVFDYGWRADWPSKDKCLILDSHLVLNDKRGFMYHVVASEDRRITYSDALALYNYVLASDYKYYYIDFADLCSNRAELLRNHITVDRVIPNYSLYHLMAVLFLQGKYSFFPLSSWESEFLTAICNTCSGDFLPVSMQADLLSQWLQKDKLYITQSLLPEFMLVKDYHLNPRMQLCRLSDVLTTIKDNRGHTGDPFMLAISADCEVYAPETFSVHEEVIFSSTKLKFNSDDISEDDIRYIDIIQWMIDKYGITSLADFEVLASVLLKAIEQLLFKYEQILTLNDLAIVEIAGELYIGKCVLNPSVAGDILHTAYIAQFIPVECPLLLAPTSVVVDLDTIIPMLDSHLNAHLADYTGNIRDYLTSSPVYYEDMYDMLICSISGPRRGAEPFLLPSADIESAKAARYKLINYHTRDFRNVFLPCLAKVICSYGLRQTTPSEQLLTVYGDINYNVMYKNTFALRASYMQHYPYRGRSK